MCIVSPFRLSHREVGYEYSAANRILLEGVAGMPGCLSYIVARDPADADALWITEVWESQEHHQASLALPSVQDAIARGRPLIAAFGENVITEPVGGHGLTPPVIDIS